MRLRLSERERAGRRGDLPDETLADPQPGTMHRLGPQPFGREELEDLAGAHDISRAHLGDHLSRDHTHDAVESLLRAGRAGHDAAQPAEQAADRGDLPRGVARGDAWGGARGVPDVAHPPAPWPSAEPDRAEVNRWSRPAIAASAWPTSSARISAVLCSRLTRPTL